MALRLSGSRAGVPGVVGVVSVMCPRTVGLLKLEVESFHGQSFCSSAIRNVSETLPMFNASDVASSDTPHGPSDTIVDLPAVRVTDYRDPSAEHESEVLVTCEHASDRLPEGLKWGPGDLSIDDHWKYDPGALDCAHDLSKELECLITESRYSRLVIDPNRPLASDTLVRTHADGKPIGLNAQGVELDERIIEYYVPYHTALGHALRVSQANLIVSVHTYNSVYEGEMRNFEVGVLMPENHKDAAYMVADAFLEGGIPARVNAPWSAASGFMYAADSLRVSVSDPRAQPLAIMLEYRNDVALDPEWRKKVTSIMSEACYKLLDMRPQLVR